MSTHMIRKQIYIQRRQDAILKKLSQERGVSEAELIRQAIEREAFNILALAASPDHSAWQELVAYLEARHKTLAAGQAYRWNREEIYAERETRWVRDRDEH